MTSYERFRAFVVRAPLDRPLRRAAFTPDLQARLAKAVGSDDLVAHFEMDDYGHIMPHRPAGYAAPDFTQYHENLPPHTTVNALGVGLRCGSLYHFTERISPLRNAERFEELEAFPIENYAAWDATPMRQEVEDRHRSGHIAATVVGHMYEDAWQIRGYEAFLTDLVTRPEWCELILDRLAARNMNLAVAAARAGVDVLICGDDVANQRALMFSPEVWRRMMKPRWARVWTAAKAVYPAIQIFYHSDGNIEPIIDDLVEIGVTILNPLQPECLNMPRLASRFRGRLLYDGSMGTQSLFPFGSPEDVRACVRERVALFGQDLILAPTHVLEPEVPIANVEAFFDACDHVCWDNGVCAAAGSRRPRQAIGKCSNG